jgi:hypothetical protein
MVGGWANDVRRGSARVQFLFQHDLNPPEDVEAALESVLGIATGRGHRRRKGDSYLGAAGGIAASHGG